MVMWDDVVKAERGHIFIDRWHEGMRFVVLRGGGSLCAYIGIPKTHPLADHDYEDLPIQAHGGLTFAGNVGLVNTVDDSLYWYGWDYGHAGDCATYDPECRSSGHRWLPGEVDADAWSALYDMGKLMKLAESIVSRKEQGCANKRTQ